MKLATVFALLSISVGLANEDLAPPSNNPTISNADLGYFTYAKRKESSVGKNVSIRVHYKTESTPPSRMWLVTLLGEGDKFVRSEDGARLVWLVGFDHHLAEMKAGMKYEVEGVLVEDQGHYGALVVYSRSIKAISEPDGTGQSATRSESKSEGGDKPQPEAEGRPR